MTENNITPPPELVQQWSRFQGDTDPEALWLRIATRAAQWGADQELLACGNYLKQCAQWEEEDVTEFYNYRRPKPPSLKEHLLQKLDRIGDVADKYQDTQDAIADLRRALEQLDD